MPSVGKQRGGQMHRATSRKGAASLARPRRPRKAVPRSASKPAASDAFTTPVLRVGCLVHATVGDPPRVRTFNYSEGERAEHLLNRNADAFHESLLAAVEHIRRTTNIPIKVLRRKKSLEPAQRARTLGMVYHLAEFALEVRGVPVIVLASATLCEQVEFGTPRSPEDIAYSKFWIRFLAPPPEAGFGDRKSGRFTLNQIERFHDDLYPLGEEMLNRMLKPYEKVLRTLSNDASLVANRKATFEVLAAASLAGDFSRLYAALRSGQNLSSQLDQCVSARQIVDLEWQNEKSNKRAKRPNRKSLLAALSRRKKMNTRFYVYETPNSYRAVFFRHMANENHVKFVGLTDVAPPSLRGDEGGNSLKSFKRLAPNAVTSNLVTDLGGLF
jgi:hypothetical protein